MVFWKVTILSKNKLKERESLAESYTYYNEPIKNASRITISQPILLPVVHDWICRERKQHKGEKCIILSTKAICR